MKVSDNYDIRELVHPAIIDRFGVERVGRNLPRYLNTYFVTAQAIRDWCACPVTYNNYMWDSDYKKGGWEAIKGREDLYINSGIRDLANPFRNNFSSHYFGAGDAKPKDFDTAQLQEDIKRNPDKFPYIIEMEDARDTRSSRGALGRDWLHWTNGVLINKPVKIFRP